MRRSRSWLGAQSSGPECSTLQPVAGVAERQPPLAAARGKTIGLDASNKPLHPTGGRRAARPAPASLHGVRDRAGAATGAPSRCVAALLRSESKNNGRRYYRVALLWRRDPQLGRR